MNCSNLSSIKFNILKCVQIWIEQIIANYIKKHPYECPDVPSMQYMNRGIFGGGRRTQGYLVRTIDYIDIATSGNAINFGNLTVNRDRLTACSNGIRGVFAGGNHNGGLVINNIEYITISTLSDAIDFGDLTEGRGYLAGLSGYV